MLFVLSLLCVPVLAGCAGESQEEVLKEFALELPQCSTEDMTFSGSADASDVGLAMSFTVPQECAKTYLKDHGVDLDRHLTWPAPGVDRLGDRTFQPTDPPFSPDAMDQFALKLDPKAKYNIYLGFRTPKKAEFQVLLVPRGDKVGVYMEDIDTGYVRGSGRGAGP